MVVERVGNVMLAAKRLVLDVDVESEAVNSQSERVVEYKAARYCPVAR